MGNYMVKQEAKKYTFDEINNMSTKQIRKVLCNIYEEQIYAVDRHQLLKMYNLVAGCNNTSISSNKSCATSP